MIFALAGIAAVIIPGQARGAVTALSTTYKTGTDLTTNSTAASPDAPGGPLTGTAHPGNTIKWVVSYQNNGTADASVDIKDPLTTAGAYVPGSLQLPPSPDPTQPFSAQFSTDQGATWQGGTPPDDASGVGLTGMFPPGTQLRSVNPPGPAIVDIANSAGDGYNAVTSADDALVYAVFHHNNTNTNVFCTTTSGGLCPGWPTGSNTSATYVSPVAGTPIGTGTNGMVTAWQNGTFIADGKLYWGAQQLAADSTGKYPVGMMCLDLATLQSCGFTELDATTHAAQSNQFSLFNGSGGPAADGNYYYADGDGNLLCFNPATGACGVTALGSGVTGSRTESSTYGSLVFTEAWAASTSTYRLYCTSVTTGAACPGHPVTLPAAAGSTIPNAPLVPILDNAGRVSGMCVLYDAVTYGCWDLSGNPVADPYPAGTGGILQNPGDYYITGTRVYVPVSSGNSVGCFDFASYTGTGTVPACTGFTPPANPANYTVRPMAGDPACLIADGDGKKIKSFDEFTGGDCTSTTATVTASPAQYYCGSGTAGFTAWNQLAVTGAPAGSYGQATVSLTDANGSPVPGFTNVTLAPGQSMNLSSISTSAPTDQLTAHVVLGAATAAVASAQATMTWTGAAPQMCFETTVPPAPCGQTATVTNAANAVTDATADGGSSDAPAGNSTGTAQFTSTPTTVQCSLRLTKTASPASASPGAKVTYTVTVTNNGTMPYASAHPAMFTDDLSGVLSDAAYHNDATASAGTVSYAAPVLSWTGPATFNPGDTATITYSVTVNDPDTGPHTMTNTVVSGSAGSSNCASITVHPACTAVVPVNSISLVKTPGQAVVNKAGDQVSYSFDVTNTGAQRLDGITVTDTVAPPSDPGNLSPVTCPDPTLAPGASETCTATYTVTQADVDHGTVDDTATASGTPRAGPAVTSPPAPASVPVAAVSVVKSTTTLTVTHAGQQVPYSFLVTNTGTVPLTGITVTDTVPPPSDPAGLSAVNCPDPTLAAGASENCTATYTVTQADVDHGRVDDSATVTGTPPATPGNPSPSPLPPSPPSAVSVPAAQSPSIAVVKSAPSADVHAAGDVIGYTFAVTNTGNMTLTGIAVADTPTAPAGPLDRPVTCPATPLAPGNTETCTGSYTVTQADVDNGSVTDTATATGTPPAGPDVTSPPSTVVVPVPAGPVINIVKSATPDLVHKPGDQITYRFTVTNTGNQPLDDITVTDTQTAPAGPLSGPVTCPDRTLAPAASETCTATYTVTQADIDHGDVTDTVTAAGTPPNSPPVTSPPVTLPVPVAQAPGITVVKSTTTKTVTRAGQEIPYSFLVTNTGNVTLTHIKVTDMVTPPSDPANLSPVTCPDSTLAPSASETCTATYTVTQPDVDHGRVDNSATVAGTPPATPSNPAPSPLPPSPPSAVSVPAPAHPAISVVKSAATDPASSAGPQVRYSFLVANTGNVTLHDVGVSDVMTPPAVQANLSPVSCPHTTLAPGASMTCTATYASTAADVARGSVGNTATAHGTPPSGPVVRSRSHTISAAVTGPVVIPTGEGASAPPPGASPAPAAAGAALLTAGAVLLMRRRRCLCRQQ